MERKRENDSRKDKEKTISKSNQVLSDNNFFFKCVENVFVCSTTFYLD